MATSTHSWAYSVSTPVQLNAYIGRVRSTLREFVCVALGGGVFVCVCALWHIGVMESVGVYVCVLVGRELAVWVESAKPEYAHKCICSLSW